jgi:hypothetical protein
MSDQLGARHSGAIGPVTGSSSEVGCALSSTSAMGPREPHNLSLHQTRKQRRFAMLLAEPVNSDVSLQDASA